MEDKHYRALRKTLIAILGDLERIQKKGKSAVRDSGKIGGPLKIKTAALMEKFRKLSRECLKLEQETREI